MSLVSKLFNSDRSQYLLDIEESGAPEIKRAQRSGRLGSISKRIFGGVLVAAVGFSALAAGFMTYSAAAPQARADWISDIVCIPGLESQPNQDDLTTLKWRAYAGRSNAMQQAANGALSPVGLEQLFSAATARHYADSVGDYTSGNYDNTAYELYGGFYPFFDAWYGAYDHGEKGDIYFLGTNGQAGTSTDSNNAHYKWKVGSAVKLNAEQKTDSALYSHNFLECGDVVKTSVVNLSNIVFLPAKIMVVVTNSVLGWALSLSNDDPGNPIVLIQHAISQLIVGEPGAQNGLKDQLYLTFLPPVLMIATLGLLYQGVIRGRSRSVLGAGLWMLLATVTGFLFVNHPMVIPGGMNNLVQTVTSALSGAIINTDGDSNSVQQLRANGKYQDVQVTDMCMVKGKNGDYAYSYGRKDGNIVQTGTSPQNYIRQTQCAIWKGMIYEPWVNGQFGLANNSGNDVLTRDPRKILSKTTVQLGNATYVGDATGDKKDLNWPLYELVAQAQGEVSFSVGGNTSKFNLGTNNVSEVAFAQLTDAAKLEKNGDEWIIGKNGDGSIARYSGKWAINGMWAGGNLDRQTGAAMLAFWGTLVVTLFVIVSAISIIGLQFSTLFLIAVSPFFFLLGVAPGWGRRVLMRWFELIMEIVIKRIMIVFVLALYIKFFDIIVNLPMVYLFRLLALGVISFVALFQRNRITKIFTDSLKFGGNQNILDGSFKKKSKQAVKTAGMVTAATGIAVLTAGAGAPIAAGMVGAAGAGAAGAAGAAGGAGAAGAAAAATRGAAAKKAAGTVLGAAVPAAAGKHSDSPQPKAAVDATGSKVEAKVVGAGAATKAVSDAGSPVASAGAKAPKTKAMPAGSPAELRNTDKDLSQGADAGRIGSDEDADELFGPVPVSDGPVAPSAGGEVLPVPASGGGAVAPRREVPRVNPVPASDQRDAQVIAAATRREARLSAARDVLNNARKSGGKVSLFDAYDVGMDKREKAQERAVSAISAQRQEVYAREEADRDAFQLEEQVRANDLAEQRILDERDREAQQQAATARQREKDAERAAEQAKNAQQAEAEASRAEARRRAIEDSRNRGGGLGGGTGPRFPTKR